MSHPTVIATDRLHILRTRPDEPKPLVCHRCELHGGTDHYLAEAALGRHLAAHGTDVVVAL